MDGCAIFQTFQILDEGSVEGLSLNWTSKNECKNSKRAKTKKTSSERAMMKISRDQTMGKISRENKKENFKRTNNNNKLQGIK